MRISTALTLASATGLVVAQRPTNTSICDYYTTALLMNNTAMNQHTLLTLVVNTAVIGNYTKPNVGISVPGILAKGTYNGIAVNLLPYFDGTLLSTDGGGNNGTSANFLDDGGAAPLKENKPCNGNLASRQCMLLEHLYQYFGGLLGCSMMGMDGFPAYQGSSNMGKVHRFMDLNTAQLGYFITQVGLSAASFGVATADVTAVGMALGNAFGKRCSAAVAIPATAAPATQAICQAASCPIADNATCAAYTPATAPLYANGTAFMAPDSTNSTMGNGTTTANGTSSTSKPSGAMSLSAMTVPAVLSMAMVIGFVTMLS